MSVVISYIAMLALLMLVSATGEWLGHDMADWLTDWLGLATQLVLPVVTLVLGYYFGSSGQS